MDIHLSQFAFNDYFPDPSPDPSESYGLRGIHFKPDGTRCYFRNAHIGPSYIYTYDLDTPWDLLGSTTLVHTMYIGSSLEQNNGFCFSHDGTKMFISKYSGISIYIYVLSTPWDLSTAVVGPTSGIPGDFFQDFLFNADGTKIYTKNVNSGYIKQYALSSPYDIPSYSYEGAIDVAAPSYQFDMSYDGRYILFGNYDSTYKYISMITLNTPFDLRDGFTGLHTKTIGGGGYEYPVGVHFSGEMDRIYTGPYNDGVIVLDGPGWQKKFLLGYPNTLDIYGDDNGSWISVGNGTPTEQMFLDNGIDEATLNALSERENDFLGIPIGDLTVWYYAGPWKTNANLTVNYTPYMQLIKASGDIDLSNISNIDSINLLTNLDEINGVIKVVLSIDSGGTWYTYNGSAWQIIDASYATSVKNDGITVADLNTMDSTTIMNLVGTSKTLRFAYLLEKGFIDTIVEVDKLSIGVDMNGLWEKAEHMVDYHYYYSNNETLTIELYTDNDFKINY